MAGENVSSGRGKTVNGYGFVEACSEGRDGGFEEFADQRVSVGVGFLLRWRCQSRWVNLREWIGVERGCCLSLYYDICQWFEEKDGEEDILREDIKYERRVM